MKKINSFALLCTAIIMLVVTSCSKGPVAKPKYSFGYDNTDAKTIIKLANPSLYERLYENKVEDGGTTTIFKGYHDASQNCISDEETICSIVVISGPLRGISPADSVSLHDSNPDLNLSFDHPGTGYLIQAMPDAPTSADVRSVDIQVAANGDKTISYVPF